MSTGPPSPSPQETVTFGPYLFDEARRRLRKDGLEIRLQGQPLQILSILIRQPGAVVSRIDLQRELWNGTTFVDFEHGLNAAINRLRQALGDSADRPHYIETVPGRGYRFVAPVSRPHATAGAETAPNPEVAAGEPPIGKRLSERWRPTAIALSVIAIAATSYVATKTPLTPRSEEITLAVMPFVNASGDEALEYVSDGLSESLIDHLSLLPGVKVIARSSSFKYKGRKVDPLEVARSLGVQVILDGRVTQRGDSLQVRVDLVDARRQTHLWGEHYSRKSSDVLSVQEQIASEIGEKLRLRLGSGQQPRPSRRVTDNQEAYRLYLTGLYHARRQTAEGLNKALGYLTQAVARDPKFAAAFASMTDVYANLGGAGALDGKLAMVKAKEAALKAMELDATVAEAHGALAIIKMQEWDWSAAESEFKRALELNPNLSGVHSDYAIYLCLMARFQEALAENQRAQRLSPLSVSLRDIEGRILNGARRYEEARHVLQPLLEMEPKSPGVHLGLGQAYLGKKMYREAIAEFSEYQQTFSLRGEATRAWIDIAYCHAVSGRRDEALAILERLRARKALISPASLAVVHAGLGNTEQALTLLERGYAERDPELLNLRIRPHFDPVRSEPRFQSLMRRVFVR